jgi:hypothetical protein
MIDQVYEYFLVRLPDHVRQMYAADLAAYPHDKLRWAIDTYRLTPPPLGHKKAPPKPLDLIALLHNELAERQAADSIASAIWGSIALYGRTQAKAAMQRIGPEGEAVVRQMGGWELLCRSCCADDANVWHAQLRDKALAVLAQNKQAQAFRSLRQATRDVPQIAAGAQARQAGGAPRLPMAQVGDILAHMHADTPQEPAFVR